MTTPDLPDLNQDAEYVRLSKLRDSIEKAMQDGAQFGQSTSAEGNAATFYSRADLQKMYDYYTDQMGRRALQISGPEGNQDYDFAQSVTLILPKY